MSKDYLSSYIIRVSERIKKFEEQWKGTRFASIDESALNPEEDNENDYEDFLEKYRGKNGNIKPLGLILYKKYLRSLFVLFLALTLLYVPVTMVYSFGKGLSKFETGSSFSKSILLLSIANLPHYRIDNLSTLEISQINFHRYLTLTCDIIAIFVVFVFVLYIKVALAKITNDYVAKSPSPNLYCIEVSNIQGCSQQNMLEHFSKFGKVAQISAIYTHQNTIYDLQKIVKLIAYLQNLKPDQQAYQKTMQKIRYNYTQLAQNYLRMPKPKLKSVFICFEEIKDRNRIYDLYKYNIIPQKLQLHILKSDNSYHQTRFHTQHSIQHNTIGEHSQNANRTQMSSAHMSAAHTSQTNMKASQVSSLDSQRLLQQYQIIKPVVSKCKFQPLTINWENCDIDKCQQRIKFFCQFILLVIVAFVILLALFLLNINSSHIKQFSVVSKSQNSNSMLLQFFENNSKNGSKIRQKYTFCASLSLSEFKWEYYDLCADYFSLQRNKFVLMLTFSLMVALINLLTNRILWALVAFRRYRTLAQRNDFLITSIFMFSLINSALLILFVRGQYTGPILRSIVGRLLNFEEEQMKVAIYNQFGRKWYMNIGSQLIMNYIVSLVIIPHFHIVLHWIRSKYRGFMEKRTQKIMKKPNFNYCTFYALSLKAIFFALIYSNSMPIFYTLCCIGLAVQMGLGKVLLKNFVVEPVFVDNNAINVATNLIPYALLFHCLTSILFLNVQQIFPTSQSYYNIYSSWTQTNLLKFQRGFIYVLIFILISIYIWNRARIDKLAIDYWLGTKEERQKTTQQRKQPKFKEIKNNPAFLASYKMKDNPKYKVLYYALRLFCAHMEKNRELGKAKIDELDSSRVYNEQIAQQKSTQTPQLILKRIGTLQSQQQSSIHQNITTNLQSDIFQLNYPQNQIQIQQQQWQQINCEDIIQTNGNFNTNTILSEQRNTYK